MAIYQPGNKKYFSNKLKGSLEIISLIGNIAFKDKELIIHAHAALGNKEMKIYGGHLNFLLVSPTCEVCLIKFNKGIKRKYFPKIGLNLMD